MTDVQEIRRRARQQMEKGAVTADYELNREEVIRLLNEALATEWVCTLRYKHHYYTAEGLHAPQVAEEFAEHAREEEQHADRIAERIKQLGGIPDHNPDSLTHRSHAEYVECDTLMEMVRENLVAERIAIESYREMIRYFHTADPVSRRLMEKILEHEEEHAEEMQSLLVTLDATKEMHR